MGRRGPAPTPTALLERRGSWRAKKKTGEPRPERGRPPCPRWLSGDAKKIWREIIPQLDQMGVLCRIDRNAVARYCTLWARWREAEEFIAEKGAVYARRDSEGRVKSFAQWPQVAIAEKLATQLLRLEQEFGLTPSARTRIQLERSSPKLAYNGDAGCQPSTEERFFSA